MNTLSKMILISAIISATGVTTAAANTIVSCPVNSGLTISGLELQSLVTAGNYEGFPIANNSQYPVEFNTNQTYTLFQVLWNVETPYLLCGYHDSASGGAMSLPINVPVNQSTINGNGWQWSNANKAGCQQPSQAASCAISTTAQ